MWYPRKLRSVSFCIFQSSIGSNLFYQSCYRCWNVCLRPFHCSMNCFCPNLDISQHPEYSFLVFSSVLKHFFTLSFLSILTLQAFNSIRAFAFFSFGVLRIFFRVLRTAPDQAHHSHTVQKNNTLCCVFLSILFIFFYYFLHIFFIFAKISKAIQMKWNPFSCQLMTFLF